MAAGQLDAYQLQLEDFAAAVRGERTRLLRRDDATAQAAAIEALCISAERGCAVEVVEPGSDRVRDDEATGRLIIRVRNRVYNSAVSASGRVRQEEN